jgi:hypothetical protein
VNRADLSPVPSFARFLGYAGLLPQAWVLASLVLGGPEIRFTALSLAFAYAALIFSFLGGVWWGLAAAARTTVPRWIWAVAVLPSLFALGAAWPWATGHTWPGPSLVVLGVLIMSSLLVDLKLRSLGLTPPGWLTLRLPLSIGLGFMTVVAGLI